MKGALVVAGRELPAILRAPATVWMLVSVSAVFAATVVLKWPASGVADLHSTQPVAVFRSLAYAMLVTIVLVVPAFPATGLVKEIKQRTMELLLNSPLKRYEIYFGKVLSLVGFVLLLLVVTVPAMACCYSMGGLTGLTQVVVLYSFMAMVALQFIVLGLLIGTYADSAESALRWAYGATFGLTVATLIPWQFLQGVGGLLGSGADFLRKLSPVPALLQLVGESPINDLGLRQPHDLVAEYLQFAGLSIVFASVVSVIRLNYSLLDRSRSQGIITDDRSVGVRSLRRLFFLVDPQKRKAGIPGYLNPILVKEFRSRQFGRLHWLLRLVAGCAILSLLLTLATTLGTVGWGVERIGGIIIVAQVALIVVFTPGLAGGVIAGELESGGWNMLRVTPLTAGKILRGKLLSVVITLLLVLCASLPGYGIMMAIKPVLREQVTQVLISLLFSAALSLFVSATVSSFFRSTAIATTVSYGILLTVFAGTMIVWVNQDAPFSFDLVQRVLSINPMAGALNAMQVAGFEEFDLVPRTWWVCGVLCVFLMCVLQIRTLQLCQPD